MGLLGKTQMGSPIQGHEVHVANDLLWITGDLETLGSPHNYINQDGMSYLKLNNPHIVPWAFSGLPSSHAPMVIVARERIQLVMFTKEESLETFRAAPKTEVLMLHLPLAIIRGGVPFLSEAKVHNFLDFWKGIFFPVVNAEIYFLAGGAEQLPTQSRLVYVNRNLLQSYVSG